jgi:hypothetical protein
MASSRTSSANLMRKNASNPLRFWEGCWILHALYVLCFTTGVILLALRDHQVALSNLPFHAIGFHPVPSFPIPSIRARRGIGLEMHQDYASNQKTRQPTFGETGGKAFRHCPNYAASGARRWAHSLLSDRDRCALQLRTLDGFSSDLRTQRLTGKAKACLTTAFMGEWLISKANRKVVC